MQQEFSAIVKTVTPKLAESWLEKNHPENRRISHKLVESFASDMRSGNWRLTHQGICFDGSGLLIDGQHRLTAVVQSGATVKLCVAHNALAKIGDPIDRSRSRSLGYLVGQDSRIVAAAKILKTFEDGLVRSVDLARGPATYQAAMTSAHMTEVIKHHAQSIENVKEILGKTKVSAGIVAAFVWSYPIASEAVGTFVDALRAESAKKGDPAAALRTWLAAGPRWPWEVAQVTLVAIAAHLSKQPLKTITSSDIGYRFMTTKRRSLKIAHTPVEDLVRPVKRLRSAA